MRNYVIEKGKAPYPATDEQRGPERQPYKFEHVQDEPTEQENEQGDDDQGSHVNPLR